MDQSKEELLGQIQRLATSRRQQAADLKGQRDALAEIDEDLPAKKELSDLAAKASAATARLKEQRDQSEEWLNQKAVVAEARALLEGTEEALSNVLVLYMVKTKKKAVHAFASDDTSVDREIVTTAKIGQKVAANLSLFEEDNE